MKSSPAVTVAVAEEAVRMLADEQGGTSMFLMLNPVFVAVLGHDHLISQKVPNWVLVFPMIMYRFCFLALLPLRLHPKV